MDKEEDIDLIYSFYIDRCIRCDFNPKDDARDPYAAQCRLCDRFFDKKKLFLNNVG